MALWVSFPSRVGCRDTLSTHPLDPAMPPVPAAACSWARAIQSIFLRHRTSAIKRSALADASPLDAVVYGTSFPLIGPQVGGRSGEQIGQSTT